MHVDEFSEAQAIACRWQQSHPADRIAILTTGLTPLVEFGSGQSGVAQAGRDASGTLS